MERTLTLFFKYKDFGGTVSEYEPFATAVVEANDADSEKQTNDWFTHIMDLKIKSDSDVAGVYISDEVKKVNKPSLKTVKPGKVIQLKPEDE
jgi:hypothetical protein